MKKAHTAHEDKTANLFASGIIAAMLDEIGGRTGSDEITRGLEAMRSLREAVGRDVRTRVGEMVFFADMKGGVGVEISGHWRIEHEVPGENGQHKVVARQITAEGGWVAQDTPSGGAGMVFFRKGASGSHHVSRKIHFCMGVLWDPSAGKPADTGYSEEGDVSWTRSFRGGLMNTRDGVPRPLPRGKITAGGTGEEGEIGRLSELR